MKISYNWLQSFFEQKLPPPKEVADALTMHSFEVEAVREVEKDTIFDIDVLPNRAHDCLAHYGVAREAAALFNVTMARAPLVAPLPDWPLSSRLFVSVEDFQLCPRYSAVVIENIAVGPSPDWLVARLGAIGERSVNNVVDAVNYVMFDIGQPLHAFDLERLAVSEGAVSIGVRSSQGGEIVETLDGTRRTITDGTLLITDATSNAVLGIAGIKGGASSAVSSATEHLIIEAANFDSVQIRKSSRALGLRTGASVRFEHALAPALTLHALREATALIVKIAGTAETEVEGYADIVAEPDTKPEEPGRHIMLGVEQASSILGTAISADDAASTLRRLNFTFSRETAGFVVTPPFERLDLVIKEDVAEEIGRTWGYERIVPQPLRPPEHEPEINKRFAYTSALRHLLARRGFSEVYTYAFGDAGTAELANPLASDKKFLRDSLMPGMRRALEQNLMNADLLGLGRVKVFEIGTVFPSSGERLALALATADTKSYHGTHSPEEEIDRTLAILRELCGEVFLKKNVDTHMVDRGMALYEIGLGKVDFTDAFESLAVLSSESEDESVSRPVRFAPISPYPFIVRDLSLWVGTGTSQEEILGVIKNAAGQLCVDARLFDTFEKDSRTSYAFRLVFQSPDRTLTDDEVNYSMWQVTRALEERQGFEVR